MKKLPYGISNYEELVEDGYEYIDKTMYIEKLESLGEKRIMFLRPRKFGKTLFTSVIENYYDKLKIDKFEKLFKDTYIGKNPTKNRNSYNILRFNFSGIDTTDATATIKGFREKTEISIKSFVNKYKLDFIINPEQTMEGMLKSLFEAFIYQKPGEKIYVIIDEYDHFANELLGFDTSSFKDLVSKNGKVRKWYEILKEGTESVVDRIFITGVTPITLDSLTSGFNVGKDITQDVRFNEMMGFTKEELINLMKNQEITSKEQEKILPIMKENYDGYKFSIDAIKYLYNSNMCLYFLSEYNAFKKIPTELIDVNIASDYSKLGKMLDLCKGERREKIIENTVSGQPIISEIIKRFNPVMKFGENELISMLFYLGYLTITGEFFGKPELKIPNNVMKEIYSDYFLNILKQETNLSVEQNEYNEMLKEIALEGRIDKIVEITEKYLNNLSNRDSIKFDEKYVKIIFYSIAMNLKIFSVRSELEVNRKYTDLLITPRDVDKDYKSVLIEFKYLKKEEENKLKEKQKEAKEQIEQYKELEEIAKIKDLRKYTIVTVLDKMYVEEI